MKSFLIVVAALAACVSAQDPVCSSGDAFVPHEDCTKYYICDNGVAVEQDCPEDLYFNPVISGCDFPYNVPECIGGTRPPIGNPSTTTIPTTTRPTTTLPTTTRPTTTLPTTTRPTTTLPTTTRPTTTLPTTTRPTTTLPTTTRPTTQKPTSSTPETPATEGTGSTALPPGVCPATGIVKIRHEEDCEKYYLCVEGTRMTESECADGLFFDPSIQECNLAELVNCVSATTAPPTTTTRPTMPTCPETGVVQLPYPGNCTLYIMCIEEVPILYKCPDGMLFDVVDAQCKPEALAVCYEGMIIKTVKDTKVVKEVENTISYWRYMRNIVGIFRKDSQIRN